MFLLNSRRNISDILRSAKERQPSDVLALVPSLSNTFGDMDLREIHSWRTRYFGKPYK